MAAENQSGSSAQAQRGNKTSSTLKIFSIIVFVLVLISVGVAVFGKSNSEDVQVPTEENQTATVPVEEVTIPEMKAVEELSSVTASCNAAASSSDYASYCQDFHKVDFDGLQVFVNCDYSNIKSTLSSTLSCADYPMDAKTVCDNEGLNDDEFVNAGSSVRTCSEARLSG